MVAVIAVIAWDLGKAARDPGGGSNSAEEIIKRRYAKGEIDRENYQRMLVALKMEDDEDHERAALRKT